MRICVLIPVYNNFQTVGDVVLRCREAIEPDIFVVSDGSTDGSDFAASQAGAHVFALPENQGKGRAILHGLEQVDSRGYTHAIVLDADGQHLPEEIPQFVAAVWDRPKCILCGVRVMNEDFTPVWSRRGRFVSNFWASLNSWQRCRDAQCGFRVYPVEQTLALGCREPGFAFEMEVLIRASWAGLKINHKEIDVYYPKADQRVSHFDMRRDNLRFAWLSFRMFWGMVLRIPLLLYRTLSKGLSSPDGGGP